MAPDLIPCSERKEPMDHALSPLFGDFCFSTSVSWLLLLGVLVVDYTYSISINHKPAASSSHLTYSAHSMSVWHCHCLCCQLRGRTATIPHSPPATCTELGGAIILLWTDCVEEALGFHLYLNACTWNLAVWRDSSDCIVRSLFPWLVTNTPVFAWPTEWLSEQSLTCGKHIVLKRWQ